MKIAAIYSRKSRFTGKGESIENQIAICKNYASYLQIDEFLIYEDEGFSGKNTNRPQFQKMLKDAKNKKFQFLICYRLDRISRNINDFSELIHTLEEYGIHFVSVNEQFDTSTPMGRAMMYIASVFAQLERETIGERVRDNMLELAKTGRWLGGQTPMGYKSEQLVYLDENLNERKLYALTPIKEELEVIKQIYEKYLQTQSINQVYKYLFSNGIKTKQGADWNKAKVHAVLRSSLYVKTNEKVVEYLNSLGIQVMGKANGKLGILTYNKSKGIKLKRNTKEWIAAISKHEGIISAEDWLRVQKLLESNKTNAPRLGKSSAALLTGILKCELCGHPMIIKQGHKSKKTGEIFHYYVCSAKDSSYKKRCNNGNISVKELDSIILSNLEFLKIKKEFLLQNFKKINAMNPSNTTHSEIQQLKRNILTKQSQMQNMILQMSLDPSLNSYFLVQIKKIAQEIEMLEKSEKLLLKKESSQSSPIDMGFFLSSINSFSKLISTLTHEEKKYLLRNLIYSAHWNGETGEVKLLLTPKCETHFNFSGSELN